MNQKIRRNFMARKRIEYTEKDIEQVYEILQQKFIDVGYVPNKLTYNNVFKFNQEIANDPNRLRHNGERFTAYPKDFWCNEYKGEPRLGKKLVDEFKATRDVEHIITDDLSTPSKLMIAKVHELKDKPEYLNKYLVRCFESTDSKLRKLEEENEKIKEENSKLKAELKLMQNTFHNLFYSSANSRNSLSNMMNLSKTQDEFAKKMVLSTFKSEDELISLIKQKPIEDEESVQKMVDLNEQRNIKAEKAKKYNLFGR